MKSRSRFTSITAAALALLILAAPLSAYPRDHGDRDRDKTPIIRFIKKITKFFGISPNEDFPSPPKP
jgi:hypothetical protein